MTIKLNAIGIVTESIPDSVAFYRLLGIEADVPDDDASHAQVDLGGLQVMWDSTAEMAKIYGGWDKPSDGRPISLAFECGSPDEVDQTYANIISAGYQGYREPWDAFWGQRYAVVVDPDGNHVDLYATNPTPS